MHSHRWLEFVPYDPEIERTFRARRVSQNQEVEIMEDTKEARARLAVMNITPGFKD